MQVMRPAELSVEFLPGDRSLAVDVRGIRRGTKQFWGDNEATERIIEGRESSRP